MKLKQLAEAIINKHCFGCYEDEAYGNASAIASIKKMSSEIGNYVEKSSDTGNEQWHIRFIAFSPKVFLPLMDVIRKSIDDGWYSLLWNDSSIYIIFSSGMSQFINSGDAFSPRVTSTNKARGLFQKNELTQEYVDHWLDKAFGKFKQINL
jgi:hypothetical protein